VRPAAALRDSVLCLPTDTHSLFVNKPSSSSSASAAAAAAQPQRGAKRTLPHPPSPSSSSYLSRSFLLNYCPQRADRSYSGQSKPQKPFLLLLLLLLLRLLSSLQPLPPSPAMRVRKVHHSLAPRGTRTATHPRRPIMAARTRKCLGMWDRVLVLGFRARLSSKWACHGRAGRRISRPCRRRGRHVCVKVNRESEDTS